MAKDTISIGFEDKIWKAADVLRGNLNASEYEGVVLGLIFLKYISDRFETKYAALVQDPLADPEDKDEEMAEHIFDYPHDALATAQQRMRQHPKYYAPYYWAGFIMLD